MKEELLYLRGVHGDCFVTELPNGLCIPWRPLTMGEFFKYDRMYRAGIYPAASIENEIFSLCVLDRAFVTNINKQLAGIISTVVAGIMAHSGPMQLEELNQAIDYNRPQAANFINELVELICLAFPAYKPEEIYAMDYSTFMLRVAQSERKLIHQGLLQEPLDFGGQQNMEEVQQRQTRRQQVSELSDKYFEQQGVKVPESIKQQRQTIRQQIIPDAHHQGPREIPEIVDVGYGDFMEQKIISKSDMMEHDAFMSGHEQEITNKIKAVKETIPFYKDYMDQLAETGTLRMKTDEERLAEAEARMEANKQKALQRKKQAMEDARNELPELIKAREEARRRKARKKALRRHKK